MMGRPPTENPKTVTIGFRPPIEVLEKLREIKAETGLSFTAIIVDRLKKSLGLQTTRETLDAKEKR